MHDRVPVDEEEEEVEWVFSVQSAIHHLEEDERQESVGREGDCTDSACTPCIRPLPSHDCEHCNN